MSTRRGRSLLGGLLLAVVAGPAWAQAWPHEQVGVPQALAPEARIAPPGEPGEPFVVSGTVFASDGKTPVEGVIVYAYHTDATGYYRPDESRSEPPRLRAWVRTGAAGRFELRTIRPGPYPGGGVPAHIHLVAWGSGIPRQEIEELRFDDDPLVTPAMRAASAKEGRFAGVRPVEKGSDGVQRCTYDIRLKTPAN
jgi:protocatechuate 3,4-dioxygenase, beta subunit